MGDLLPIEKRGDCVFPNVQRHVSLNHEQCTTSMMLLPACPQSIYKGAWIFGVTMRPFVKFDFDTVDTADTDVHVSETEQSDVDSEATVEYDFREAAVELDKPPDWRVIHPLRLATVLSAGLS